MNTKALISLVFAALLLAVSRLFAATLYVSQTSTNPTQPFATWDTAATNIQQAVGAASAGDRVVVTNGVYAGNVAVTNPLVLVSVNGPQFTVINGGGVARCVSVTDGTSLSGFTLTNGSDPYAGAGVWCASTNAFFTNCVVVGNRVRSCIGDGGGGVHGCTLFNCTLTSTSIPYACAQGYGGGGAFSSVLFNCTLSGNSGTYGGGAGFCTLYNCTLSNNLARYGGGASACTLYNCVLSSNSGLYYGGGAGASTLYNCTLTGNSATSYAGGAIFSVLYNCIIYSNTSPDGANYDSDSPVYKGQSTLNYCCTTPLPTNGVGNITNAPLFVDAANGDLHPQSNSPCINAGNNAYVSYTTDLDGNPRIVSGTVDIGAYEFQGTGSVISYAWLQQYGLPTNGSVDYGDPDGDRMNNWQEWICGTDPTNSASVFTMLTPSNGPSGKTVPWQSVSDRTYALERSASLNLPFALLATNIPGQPGTTSYTDTNATGAGSFFYRVGTQR